MSAETLSDPNEQVEREDTFGNTEIVTKDFPGGETATWKNGILITPRGAGPGYDPTCE